jgi:hypothetical protein
MADQVVNSAVKQRRFARYSFIATADVISLDTDTRLSAQTSELGLGGCYIDTLNPFPEGTLVRVRLVKDTGAFESSAKVVYVLPGFGMGLAFTHLPHDQKLVLDKWIAELSKG